jgi:hypothetical protein
MTRMEWADQAAQACWTGQDEFDGVWSFSIRDFAWFKELISMRELAPFPGYEAQAPASAGTLRKRLWRAAHPERAARAERERSQARRSGYTTGSSDSRYEASPRRNHQRELEDRRRRDRRIAENEAKLAAGMEAFRAKHPGLYEEVYGDGPAV